MSPKGNVRLPNTPRDTVRRLTRQVCRQARADAATEPLMAEVFQHTTAVVEALPVRAALACAQGCAFCCYHPVDLTPPEAFVLVAYLQAALPPAAREAASGRIAAQAARLRGLSYEEQAQARWPCALLVEGQCSVYPCRPLACRAWTSTSAAACEAIYTHGSPVTQLPPLDMAVYEAVWDAARGVTDGLRQEGLAETSYELHSLLQRLITTPEAARRWARGEPVFAGCTVGAFTA